MSRKRRKRIGCMGSGPMHSKTFTMGEYKNQRYLISGRSITVRGVEVRRCGCQNYPHLGPMLDLLLAHPKKSVVTWDPKLQVWR